VTQTLLRPQAETDLIERTRHYRREGGDDLGERFFDAAALALAAIGRMPGAGSPRWGELCGIEGLRVRRVLGFPCGWFYFARDDRIDIVRLVAGAQDIAAVLADIEHE